MADAKSKVCAYQKVRRTSYMNANRTGGEDPTAQLALAVNDRQIYEAGSAYLLTTLTNEAATPADLADAVSEACWLISGHYAQLLGFRPEHA